MDAKVSSFPLCLPLIRRATLPDALRGRRCHFIFVHIRGHPDCLPSTSADRFFYSHNALQGLSVYATRTRYPNYQLERLCTRAESQHQHYLH